MNEKWVAYILLALCLWRLYRALRTQKEPEDDGIVWNEAIISRMNKEAPLHMKLRIATKPTKVQGMTSDMPYTSSITN